MLLMVLDAVKPHSHKEILTRELEAVGIRLNRSPPQIHLKRKKTGTLGPESLRFASDTCSCLARRMRIENVVRYHFAA
jgi:ribosome-interacting GTPase 1